MKPTLSVCTKLIGYKDKGILQMASESIEQPRGEMFNDIGGLTLILNIGICSVFFWFMAVIAIADFVDHQFRR
jgi:hypothetical protein